VALLYHHVDVFAPRPYTGNSLAVFLEAPPLSDGQMATITRELRHFESIFLTSTEDTHQQSIRVYDLLGELDFAGHPVIGAAAVLHAEYGQAPSEQWTMHLTARSAQVTTTTLDSGRYVATMSQGAASFVNTPEPHWKDEFASWFGLEPNAFDERFPAEVVSTGLRYLLLPVRSNVLAAARICIPDLENRLAQVGAEFAYLLDVAAQEGRHWNNDGVVEDVATGSAAGCVAAYLRRHEIIEDDVASVWRQGRFMGRPSEMTIRARGSGTDVTSVDVGGEVALIGSGRLEVPPE
jgi:PhzF family phenazine biosynthesis protein